MDLLNKERLPQACLVNPGFVARVRCQSFVIRVHSFPDDRQSYCFWKDALAAGLVGMTLHFAVTKRRNQSLNQQ